MVPGMSSKSKTKGDQAERDAVAVLVETAGDLVDTYQAKRLLGAGRKQDESDLLVFTDVAIQVKFWPADISGSIREAASGAIAQAGNANKPIGLGLVKFPNARNGSLRWMACVPAEQYWPGGQVDAAVYEFKMVSTMLTWLRTDTPPFGFLAHPREQRFARLTSGAETVLVAPLEAWVTAFREYRSTLASITRIPGQRSA